jgi:hypothetical protein
MTKADLIINIETPDHKHELSRATELLKKVDAELKRYKDVEGKLPYDVMKKLHYTTNTILFIIGDLSTEIFAKRDNIEALYFKEYKSQPALAKKLWLDHYENLHAPYDKLKNKCRHLLGQIDPNGQIRKEEEYDEEILFP